MTPATARLAGACLLGVLMACHASGGSSLQLVSPSETDLAGFVELEVLAPNSATAVRFFVDDIHLAELTDLYATRVAVNPTWKTGIDVGWLPGGPHTLRAEADTGEGTLTVQKSIHTQRRQDAPSTTSLSGTWKFAALPSAAIRQVAGQQKLVLQPGYSERTLTDLDGADAVGVSPKVAQNEFDDSAWTTLLVPSSFGAVDDQWNSNQGTVGVYRKRVTLSRAPSGITENLVLDSCYFACRVFVNGSEVGRMRGGHLPYSMDVTSKIVDGENLFVVIVDNRLETMGELGRVHRFRWNYGGIPDDVRLERHPNVGIVRANVRRAEASGSIYMWYWVHNNSATAGSASARVEIFAPSGARVVDETTTITIEPGVNSEWSFMSPFVVSGTIQSPVTVKYDLPSGGLQLWSHTNPALYHIRITPQDATGRVFNVRTGIRDVDTAGAAITINGNAVTHLQGIAFHGDYPGLGAVQPAPVIQQRFAQLKAAGYSLVRGAYQPLPPAALTAADELGLLVVEELNVVGVSGAGLVSDPVFQHGFHAARVLSDRDAHHPSVIAWSMGAELESDAAVSRNYFRYVSTRAAQERLSAASPSRLLTHLSDYPANDAGFLYNTLVSVAYNAGWETPQVTDVTALLDGLAAAGKPVLLGEYGSSGVLQREGTTAGSEFVQSQLIDKHNEVLASRPGFLGKVYAASHEFVASPDWSGGNPKPVPPYNSRGLVGFFGEKKLGWRVMFSPVRLSASVLEAKPDSDTTLRQEVVVRDVRGTGATGTLLVSAPHGFVASPSEQSFTVQPGGERKFEITYQGSIRSSVDTQEGLIRAVINAESEAHPLRVTIRRADAVQHPSSERFFDTAVNTNRWQVIREDPAGWSLVDRPDFLRLTTLPGTQSGSTNTGKNLFLTKTEMVGDFTAVATVEGEVSLYVYRSDDDFVRVGMVTSGGVSRIQYVHEHGGTTVASATSAPITIRSLLLRTVRRGEQISADYSLDNGVRWFSLGTAEPPPGTSVGTSPLAGSVRLGLQATADSTGGAAVATYVDRLAILVSGRVEVNNIAGGADLALVGGTKNVVPLSISNWTEGAVELSAAIIVPRGWTRERQTVRLNPFTTLSVNIPVTPPLAPEVGLLTAQVEAVDGTRIHRRPQANVVSIPAGPQLALALDAGREDSPVTSGYTRLSPSDVWSSGASYGWVVPPGKASDPAHPALAKLDALRRDFVFSDTGPATLRIRVPPGRRTAYALIGDGSAFTKNTLVESNGVVIAEVGRDLEQGAYEWIRFEVEAGPDGTADLVFGGERASELWKLCSLVVLP